MSIRATTMSNSYSPTTRHSGFLQKLVITLLFVVGIAGFMALLNLHQKNLSLFWMAVFAILSIGLAAGSSARMAFYRRSGFVRFLVMLIAVLLGLFSLGVFTVWQIGIGPLKPWIKGSIPQDELIQLGGALLVALISLEAWWKPRPKIEDAADIQISPRARDETPAAAVILPPQPRQQNHVQENLTFVPKGKSRLKFAKAPKSRSRKTSAVNKLFVTHTSQPARSKRKRLFNHKPQLQISVFEEHRCPYCLDEVKRNDPRGVKECEVCHSLHHADCWAITGMCQVPHLNT